MLGEGNAGQQQRGIVFAAVLSVTGAIPRFPVCVGASAGKTHDRCSYKFVKLYSGDEEYVLTLGMRCPPPQVPPRDEVHKAVTTRGPAVCVRAGSDR